MLINCPSVDPSMKVHSKWYAVADGEKLNLKTCSENNLNSFISIIFFLDSQYVVPENIHTPPTEGFSLKPPPPPHPSGNSI